MEWYLDYLNKSIVCPFCHDTSICYHPTKTCKKTKFKILSEGKPLNVFGDDGFEPLEDAWILRGKSKKEENVLFFCVYDMTYDNDDNPKFDMYYFVMNPDFSVTFNFIKSDVSIELARKDWDMDTRADNLIRYEIMV